MMEEYARKFYNLGLNIFPSSYQLNECNFNETNLLKAPNIFKSYSDRQSQEEFNSINWKNIKSFGTFLGFNSLCALDIDGALNTYFLEILFKMLGLPKDYEWIFQSGSHCGYHIIFRCNLPKNSKLQTSTEKIILPSNQIDPFELGDLDTNAYYPKVNYQFYHKFYKLEFKWAGNLILPPSVHITGSTYSFLNKFPVNKPIEIDFEILRWIKNTHSTLNAKSSDFRDIEGVGPIRHSFHMSYPDSLLYNFQAKIKEPGLAFHICQYKVFNYNSGPLFLNQISWIIFDKHYNIIKRRTFNYFTFHPHPSIFCNKIDINVAKSIIENPRFIFHEFLFDLSHTDEIVCWDDDNLDIIKYEILSKGLYLDAFIAETKISYSPNDSIPVQLSPTMNKPVSFVICRINQFEGVASFETDHDPENSDDTRDPVFGYNYNKEFKQFKNINSLSFLIAIYTMYLVSNKN